ncbi:hypothetical protein Tco_1431066 [Tanacetum coccineum]
MPLEGIHVDDKLQFVEEPVEIMEREIKRLKRSRIPLVKVRWNSRRGPEFTWEREDSFKQKYPQLFTNRASSSTTRELPAKKLEEIQKLYEREQKWINDFVLMDYEVVKDSRKGKAEGSRKKTVARKRTGDDEVINVESLATKYPIVDWKTHVYRSHTSESEEMFGYIPPSEQRCRGFSRIQETSVINGSPHLHSIGGMEEDEDTLEKTQREARIENEFSNSTMQLVQSIDERRSFIQELERLPGNLEAYQTREELKGLQKDDLIKAMETRKYGGGIYRLTNMLPEWDRFVTAVKLNRGLETSNYDQLYAYLKQHEAYANENKIMLERYNQHAIDPLSFVSNILPQQYPTQSSAIPQSAYIPPVTHQPQFADNTQLDSEYFKDKMLLKQAQENGMVLDEEKLFFIAGGQANMFDDDVDEAPVQDLALNEDNTMFMENLLSADPIYDEAGPSYDSDILSEVQDHDNYLDNVGEYHEVHKMQNNVQQNYIVDSNAEYTSDSNIIPYEQYVKDNTEQVVQSNVSSVPNDALMMIINEMHEQAAQYVSANEQNKVVNASLTAELARYKEQVVIYEKKGKYALYNGHEIVKTNHAPVVVHDSEDTLEFAEITRKRMLEKVKIPLCVEKKAKIAQPDYSKENYLATFTLQRHLTPEQIFWSSDISKMTPKPISRMMVYLPNTPARLVPRVIPTKIQVKINLYTFIQLFSEFDKTCKKRITPCGLTEGERGFEQTKECYLTEVILFFKMHKEHFERVQTALIKEVKEMKEIFQQMEAEVDQNVVDKKSVEIERKNLLIENENLIVDCLSTELLYSVMNVVNTVSRFSKMPDAYTVEQARIVKLEAGISRLKHKI